MINYNEYFDQSFINNVIVFLKRECKIGMGFYSQIVGKKEIMSATSTSIIYYVLSKINALSEQERKVAIEEILSFKQTSGFYRNAIGTENDITTWGTAQACLALLELKCDDKYCYEIIDWLCSVQKDDGGWSYDGREDGDSNVLYCFYIALVLNKYKGNNEHIRVSFAKMKKYIDCFEVASTAELVMKIFLIDFLEIRKVNDNEKFRVYYEFREMVLNDNMEESFTESSMHGQGHFYINFLFNAYYLLLRRFIEPTDDIALYIMRQIHDSIIHNKGWSNRNSEKGKVIYSWATALTLLSIRTWISDCGLHKVNVNDYIAKLRVIRKEALGIVMFMPRCPLNGGQCNLKDEIKQQYSDKKIFLDIPYERKYKTFENQINATIKNCGLEIVIAKQTQKTKMILCKVCSLIQTCKYGVADISYESLNVPFELGLMYGLGKECAILKAADAPQPTDIDGIEYIEYINTDELHEGLSKWLQDNIE